LGVEQRLAQRRLFTQQYAVAVDALPGHAIQPLGSVLPLDLHGHARARLGLQAGPGIAKTVFREFVAVAADIEEDRLVHQPRLVKGDQPRAIGDEAEVIDGLQFDQRHSAAGLGVAHLDLEIPALGSRTFGCGQQQREQATESC
jgi:hypothetical protein